MPDREPLDVLEAIHSTPARRYLKPDPIPEDELPSFGAARTRHLALLQPPPELSRVASAAD